MIKDAKTGIYTHRTNDGDVQKEFNYYTDINASSKTNFVRSIVDVIVDDDCYHSVVLDTIIDYQIINVFTDVDVSEITDIDSIEELLEETNILDIVKPNIKDGLLDELVESIKMNIEYRTGIHYSYLGETITKFMKKINKSLEGVDTTALLEAISNFKDIKE